VELTMPMPTAAAIMGFVLVLTRIGAVMAIAPLFSSRAIPLRVRALVAVTVTFLVMPMVKLPSGLAHMSMPAMFEIMLKEAAVGLAIGFAAGVVMLAWAVGGAVLDLMAGFSFGGVIDPIYGNQTSILQQIYTLLAGMIFISVGGEQWVLAAISRSFERMPLTEAPAHSDFAALALSAVNTVFITGLGVIAPVFVALLLTDVAFGLVARAAPQTQIIQVEFPVKIVVGLSILIVSLPLMVPLFVDTLNRMLGIAVGGG
jgi:flagellar biosynthetic protein FliR